MKDDRRTCVILSLFAHFLKDFVEINLMLYNKILYLTPFILDYHSATQFLWWMLFEVLNDVFSTTPPKLFSTVQQLFWFCIWNGQTSFQKPKFIIVQGDNPWNMVAMWLKEIVMIPVFVHFSELFEK